MARPKNPDRAEPSATETPVGVATEGAAEGPTADNPQPAPTEGDPTDQSDVNAADTEDALKLGEDDLPQRDEESGADPEAGVDEDRIHRSGADDISDEPTVTVDLSAYRAVHPYNPMGPGSWGFRFGDEEDPRFYLDDYSAAVARAAADARKEGVQIIHVSAGSTSQ